MRRWVYPRMGTEHVTLLKQRLEQGTSKVEVQQRITRLEIGGMRNQRRRNAGARKGQNYKFFSFAFNK